MNFVGLDLICSKNMFARSLSLNFQANSAYLVRRAMSGAKKGSPVLKMSAPLAAVVGTDSICGPAE